MYYIQKYIRDQINLFCARQWLAHDGIRAALSALYHLNKSPNGKVYALKNEFVKRLYELGYCKEVTAQRQDMECYRCGGTGDYYGSADCYHCDGTGIYRSHLLYRFVFEVEGRVYIWHQPQSLVTWPVTLSMGMKKYTGKRIYHELERDNKEILCATVYAWLLDNGFEGGITEYRTLAESISCEYRHLAYQIRTGPRQLLNDIDVRLRNLWDRIIYPAEAQYDDELPF